MNAGSKTVRETGTPYAGCAYSRSDIASVIVLYSRMPVHSNLSFSESLSGDHRRAFYEAHRSFALFMILVVFLSPFAGLYVANLVGAVLGIILSAAAFYFTPYVWLKISG